MKGILKMIKLFGYRKYRKVFCSRFQRSITVNTVTAVLRWASYSLRDNHYWIALMVGRPFIIRTLLYCSTIPIIVEKYTLMYDTLSSALIKPTCQRIQH